MTAPALTTKKRRADSTLDSLPEEIQGEIIDRDRANDSLSAILAWLAADHAVATSRSALSVWLSRQRTLAMRNAMRASVTAADTMVSETAAMNNGPVDAHILAAARQAVLDTLNRGGDMRTAKDLLGLVLKSQSQTLDERRLHLEEKKFQLLTAEAYLAWRNDDRARQIADGPGTHDAKIAALRDLFFAPGEHTPQP